LPTSPHPATCIWPVEPLAAGSKRLTTLHMRGMCGECVGKSVSSPPPSLSLCLKLCG